jgi:hypothetical protein
MGHDPVFLAIVLVVALFLLLLVLVVVDWGPRRFARMENG